MQITMQSIGQPVSDFSVSGATITVSGKLIDCSIHQADTETSLNVVKMSDGKIEVNPKKGGYGLAIITIPAKTYQSKPALDVDGNPVLDMNGSPSVTREPNPLDPNAIAVTLWPII